MLPFGLVQRAIPRGHVDTEHCDRRLDVQGRCGHTSGQADAGELVAQVASDVDPADQRRAAVAVVRGGVQHREAGVPELVEQVGGAGAGTGLGEEEDVLRSPAQPSQ